MSKSIQQKANPNIGKHYKVLLTGASGTVGHEIAKQLIAYPNIELTIFDLENNRSKKKFKSFSKETKIVFGDISEKSNVASAVKGQDIIIHLAAIIPPLADEHPKLAYTINVEGTKNIIEAMEQYAPEAMLFYSSSISVYGDRINNPNIKVGDPLQASVGDEYAKTKIECERMIQNSPLNWTIFRLTAIMKDHRISKLMFHMPLETTIEICTPEDTARAFINGIFKKEYLNKKKYSTLEVAKNVPHPMKTF